MYYYLIRGHGKDGEAKAMFASDRIKYPVIWFGIESLENFNSKESTYKIIGTKYAPYEGKACWHANNGNARVREPYRDFIQSFDWAEQISEARYETYVEMAGLPVLEFEFVE